MMTKKSILSALCSLCIFITVDAQKMWISGIYDHNTISYYEHGKLTEIGTVWNTPGNTPTGQESNGKHMAAYGEFKSHQNDWYFEMEQVHLTSTKLNDGTFEVFANNNCPIRGVTEGSLVLENGDKIEIASLEEITPGHYITVEEAEYGTSICNGKRIPTYYIRKISTKATGRGVKPYYMSKDTKEFMERQGGQYIQDVVPPKGKW